MQRIALLVLCLAAISCDKKVVKSVDVPVDWGGAVGDDRAVLVVLYEATGGANWNLNTNWLSEAPLDEWDGVIADGEGRVLQLALGGNGLTGSIPAELGQLKNLRFLGLSLSDLTGSIPAELGQLKNLRVLGLNGNELTGSIPAELGQLKNLTWLALDGNELTGSIPAELGQLKNLEVLALDDNELSGSIPAELGQLKNLRQLRLGGNGLTGCIPSGLEYMRDALDRLGLSFCR